MDTLHQHDDMEMNYLVQGKVTYLYQGKLFELPPRRLVAFWGTTPHRVVQVDEDAMLVFVHVPAAWLLEWGLPFSFVDLFLSGSIFLETNERRSGLDEELVMEWARTFSVDKALMYAATLPEIQARLHRLASTSVDLRQMDHGTREAGGCAWKRVEQVARFIANHFQEPLSINTIADAVGLTPTYMMHLFRERCGVSVLEYLTSFRLAHAQLLLVTTEATVLDIALESGFNSLSRFYTVFRKTNGVSPARYRKEYGRYLPK